MMGKTARWMRLLGYDVTYFTGQTDKKLMEKAEKENRLILTRDTHLATERAPDQCFLVHSTDFMEQLKKIIERFPLDFNKTFLSRCPHCNVMTETVSKEEVWDRLPPKVKQWATTFKVCPKCHHVYWDGTHVRDMLRILKEKIGIEIHPENWNPP